MSPAPLYLLALASLLAVPAMASDAAPPLAKIMMRQACHQPMRIVAFGSSSTEGIGASAVSKSYPSLLPGELQQLLPNEPLASVINRGIGGDDINDMMRRLQAKEYLLAVRQLGIDENVPVLPRYDWMVGWMQDFGPAIVASDKLHMSDLGYALLAKATAKLIVEDMIKASHPVPPGDCKAMAGG
jgi:lysophospholipase L1-like esterase